MKTSIISGDNFIYYKDMISSLIMSDYLENSSNLTIKKIQDYILQDKFMGYVEYDKEKAYGFCLFHESSFRDDSSRVFIDGILIEKDRNLDRNLKLLLSNIENYASINKIRSIYLKLNSRCKLNSMLKEFGYLVERVKMFYKINSQHVYPIIPDNIRELDAEVLSDHIEEFAQLYLMNDKAHILCDSSTIEGARRQMVLLKDYLHDGKAYVFYAIENNIICGVFWAYPCSYDYPNEVHIKQSTVLPAYRRKNIGENLKIALFKKLQDKGQFIVTTYNDAVNYKIINLNLKMGFEYGEMQFVKTVAL